AKKYMTGWFALDAIAAIPWSWIGDSTAAQMTRSLKVVRLVRLARLLRLAKLRQITEAAEMFMEGKYLAELIMGFGKVLLLLCAVAHWCACFWHAVGNEE
ncbi:KCNH6, partial [Symbiodinium sp. CCMP2456]